MGYVMGGAAMERALPATVPAWARAAAARAATRARRHGASNNCTAQLSEREKWVALRVPARWPARASRGRCRRPRNAGQQKTKG